MIASDVTFANRGRLEAECPLAIRLVKICSGLSLLHLKNICDQNSKNLVLISVQSCMYILCYKSVLSVDIGSPASLNELPPSSRNFLLLPLINYSVFYLSSIDTFEYFKMAACYSSIDKGSPSIWLPYHIERISGYNVASWLLA